MTSTTLRKRMSGSRNRRQSSRYHYNIAIPEQKASNGPATPRPSAPVPGGAVTEGRRNGHMRAGGPSERGIELQGTGPALFQPALLRIALDHAAVRKIANVITKLPVPDAFLHR